MFIKDLPPPKSGYINHICHISDIHIRAGIESKNDKCSRFTEYINVFDKITRFLQKKYTNNDLVICITGDILHDNRKAGAPCIELFYSILNRLTGIAPVYIIRGNHDYNQSSIETQDMITALLSGYNIVQQENKIAYLSETGQYNAANVSFGIVAIQDVLKSGNTHGLVEQEELPNFPKTSDFIKTNEKLDYTNIALFHGDVLRSNTSIDWILKNNNYDYALLGDLHCQQVSGGEELKEKEEEEVKDVFHLTTHSKKTDQNTTIWGYAGSTIQQNFGESLLGHGFFMWDLIQKKVKTYHVKNDFGFITAKVDLTDSKHVLFNASYPKEQNVCSLWITVDEMKNKLWSPSILRLRINKNTTHNILDTQHIHEIIQNNGLQVESSQTTLSSHDINHQLNSHIDFDSSNTFIDLNSFNQPSHWCEFLEQKLQQSQNSHHIAYHQWKDWIIMPQSLCIPETKEHLPDCLNQNIIHDIKDRNKKITLALNTFKTAYENIMNSQSSHTHFECLYMNWSNILCFDTNCHFNFQKLKGHVYCISGKNGYGKTSFLETIIIAIFGEGFPSRVSKHITSSIINVQKNRANTSIVIKLDNQIYRIKRLFTKTTKDENKIQAKEASIEILEQDVFKEIQSGKKATTEWINQHVGSLDTFLTSCMISQTSENEFFEKKPNEQKLYLDTQLKLNSSSTFMALLKTAKLAYNDITKRITDLIELKQSECNTAEYNNLIKEKDQLQIKYNDVITQLKNAQTIVTQLQPKLHKIDTHLLQKGQTILENEFNAISIKLDTLKHVDTHKLEEINNNIAVTKSKFDEIKTYYNKTLPINSIHSSIQNHIKLEPKYDEKEQDPKYIICQINKHTKTLQDNDYHTIHQRISTITQTIDNDKQKLDKLNCQLKTIETKKNNLDQSQKNVQDKITHAMNNQPEQPIYSTEQYKQWIKQLRQYDKLYSNIQKLYQIIHDHQQTQPQKPPVSLTPQKIQQDETKLEQFILHTQKNIKKMDQNNAYQILKHITHDHIDIKPVQQIIKSLQTQYNNDNKIYNTSLTQLLNIDENISNQKTQHQHLQNTYHNLIKNAPPSPHYKDPKKQEQEYKKFKTKYDESVALHKSYDHDNMEHISDMLEQYPIDYHDYIGMEQEIDVIQNMLNKCEDYEFNPKCKACKNHPWKIKRDSFITQVQSLNTKKQDFIDMLISTGTEYRDLIQQNAQKTPQGLQMLNGYKNKLSLYTKHIDNHENNIKQHTFWTEEKQKHTEFMKWQTDIEKIKNDIHNCESIIKQLSHEHSTLNLKNNNLHKTINKIEIIKRELEDTCLEWSTSFSKIYTSLAKNKIVLSNWTTWKNTMDTLSEHKHVWESLLEQEQNQNTSLQLRDQRLLWNSNIKELGNNLSHISEQCIIYQKQYQKSQQQSIDLQNSINIESQKLTTLKNNLTMCQNIKQELDMFENINKQIQAHQKWKETLIMLQTRLKAHELYDQYTTLQTYVDNIHDKNTWMSQKDNIEQALLNIDLWNTYQHNLSILEKQQENKIHIASKLAVIDDTLSRVEQVQKHVETLIDYHVDIENRLSTSSLIFDEFGSFKDWIIEQKIIPLILQHLNTLLAHLCQNHRSLQLKCEIDNVSKNFIWLVDDSSQIIPFEKSSGFQKSAINLAMRIVLGKLGVSGMHNTQLFIDEGFTSCDNDNLENIPQVLENLLQNYHSIVIVTHLENLKNNITSSINIQRNENTNERDITCCPNHGSQIIFGDKIVLFDTLKKVGRQKRDI